MKLFLKPAILLVLTCGIYSSVFSQDNPEQTKKIVMDLYDKINSHDVTGAMKNIDSKCIDHIPFSPDQKAGLDGFKQIFDMLIKAYPDFNQSINDLIISSDGKKVSILVTITGTNSGDFMGMPATNRKINVLGVDILHIENGRFTDHWGFIDNQTMMQQLGVSK